MPLVWNRFQLETVPKGLPLSTIRDVASLAGVSLGTASRVLNGGVHTSRDARDRVQAAATKLGYVANGPARSLRRARTDTIGLIVSDIRNPFFSTLAHAVEDKAREAGIAVLLANTNEDPALTDMVLRAFSSQRVDGLILVPQGSVTPQLEAVVETGIPIVLANRRIAGLDLPIVRTDDERNVDLVLGWLRKRGHSEVAFLGGPEGISTVTDRLDRYRAGRRANGISMDEGLIELGNLLEDGATQAMLRVLESGRRPTAVVGVNGPTVFGAVRALRQYLGTAAQSVEAVSFDDLEWFAYTRPGISAIRNDVEGMGSAAVETLLAALAGQSVRSQTVGSRLIDRADSTQHLDAF